MTQADKLDLGKFLTFGNMVSKRPKYRYIAIGGRLEKRNLKRIVRIRDDEC